MKKILYIIFGTAILGLFIWTLVYLYQESQTPVETFKTEKAFYTDIVKKSVATGSIVPRKEIAIKPRVSGVLEKIYVEPGQFIKEGELIALIRIIPNMVSLNNAETSLNQARINFEDRKREMERNEKLFQDKIISEVEYNQMLIAFKRSKEELDAAENNLQLIREGSSKKGGKGNTKVYSTVSGKVLDIPVKEGSSVIESNTFNEGTTVASIADMNDMIFIGKIDESEVDKVKEGMDLILTLGALEGKTFHSKLEFISPKGADVEGSIQFEIRASVQLPKEEFIRAGYSATADIVFSKVEKALAISEKLVQFENGMPYVEVEKAPQEFEKRKIKLGLSDGINVQVLEGISTEDKIKKLNNDGTATSEKSGGQGVMGRRKY
ncbi:MAG: efflux RND transporter periplasmic adaptor subunit [Cytophagaceae bacterium]|nr:efflux RND transporter periplasmic adaptor subunit [Cytophagaceae bacterium]